MNDYIYKLGSSTALTKLGIQLDFDSPEDAARHHRKRIILSKVTGAAGNVGGGVAGGIVGSGAGPVGTLGGSVVGSELGQRAVSAPATLAYDVAHDIPQKAKSQYRSSLARMNAAAGLPTGIAKPPTGR